MRDVLCDCLGMIELKIKSGSVTIGDLKSILEALAASVGIKASAKEIAEYYGESEVNVRSLIKRRLISKPQRRVYYNFSELCKKVPKSWHIKSCDKDE